MTTAPGSRPSAALRRIWLCADDYGIAPGVNAAIRELVAQGRLNATSVMTPAPSCTREAADALAALNTPDIRVAIGLHLTLTGPFRPLTEGFAPLGPDGAFCSIGRMLGQSYLRPFDPDVIAREVEAQTSAFVALFGRPPDFVDGHQHVHLLPGVRDPVLAATRAVNPAAWVRQCAPAPGAARRLGDPKGLLIARLSGAFRERADALGVATNPAFAGTYTFDRKADFAALFPEFLEGLPDGGLVMCHPGRVDAELARLDPLTTLREKELAFLSSDDFAALLAMKGVTLSRPH